VLHSAPSGHLTYFKVSGDLNRTAKSRCKDLVPWSAARPLRAATTIPRLLSCFPPLPADPSGPSSSLCTTLRMSLHFKPSILVRDLQAIFSCMTFIFVRFGSDYRYVPGPLTSWSSDFLEGWLLQPHTSSKFLYRNMVETLLTKRPYSALPRTPYEHSALLRWKSQSIGSLMRV